MNQFLYLFIGGNDHTGSPEEMQQVMARWMAWIGTMEQAGIYKGGDPLEAGGKTLAGSEPLVTDGPFAEAKEVVGGYILVETKTIDEAVDHAKRCPIFADGGRVEVRPVMQMDA